jgi:serine/threonine-protein kinase
VPSLSGPLLGAAQRLAAAGFRVSLAYVPGTSALGTVVAQQPAAGSTAPSGSHVTVNVSAGRGQSPPARVPDGVGKTVPEGVSALNQAGLRLIFLRYPVSSKTEAGKIIEQSPPAGANAPKNAQILVYMGAYQK